MTSLPVCTWSCFDFLSGETTSNLGYDEINELRTKFIDEMMGSDSIGSICVFFSKPSVHEAHLIFSVHEVKLELKIFLFSFFFIVNVFNSSLFRDSRRSFYVRCLTDSTESTTKTE